MSRPMTKQLLWVSFGLLSLGCGGTQTPGGGQRVANPARTDGGQVVVSQGSGQAVSATANTRFEEAARQLRAHDEANNNRGDWAAASCNDVANAFEAAANAQPGGAFPEAWTNRGIALDRCSGLAGNEGTGFRDRARQALQHAVDVAQNHRFCRAQVQLAVLQFRENQTENALAAFRQAAQDDRTCVEAFTNVAMILRERNQGTDRQDAVAAIRSALARDDRFVPALNQLALTYLQEAGTDPRSQRLMLAGIVCQQAVQVTAARSADMTPEVRTFVADVYNTWGLVDIRSGQIIRALDHFRRAYELNPQMFQAWMNYGTINLSFRGYSDARTAFQHAVELRANDYDAHIGLGVALRGLEQYPQAEAEYNRARELDQNRPDSYYNLGLLYESYMGGTVPDLQRAQQYLQQFRTKAGNDPRWAEAVQRASRHENNISQAINALNAAAALNALNAGAAGGGAGAADGGAAGGGAAPAAAADAGAAPATGGGGG